MNSRTALLLAGALIGGGAVALSQAHLTAMAPAQAALGDSYRVLNLFGDVFNRVRSDYVENPDESLLIEGAIKGMLGALDPHSSYMTAKDFKGIQAEMTGKFGGLGIEVTMEDGVIKVVSPIDDTPASRAGLLANDLIIKIDGEEVQGMALSDAVDKMRGPVHTPITLTVFRKLSSDKPFDVKLTREEIVVQSVKSRAEGQVGYLRISQFSEQTSDGLKAAIDKIKADIGKDKVQGYIIDLRNDPGGLLDQAVDVADDFLDSGEIVSIADGGRATCRATRPRRATLPAASRSSCSSMAAPPRPRRSSPAPCRTIIARRCSARAPSARARSRRSSRSARMAR